MQAAAERFASLHSSSASNAEPMPLLSAIALQQQNAGYLRASSALFVAHQHTQAAKDHLQKCLMREQGLLACLQAPLQHSLHQSVQLVQSNAEALQHEDPERDLRHTKMLLGCQLHCAVSSLSRDEVACWLHWSVVPAGQAQQHAFSSLCKFHGLRCWMHSHNTTVCMSCRNKKQHCNAHPALLQSKSLARETITGLSQQQARHRMLAKQVVRAKADHKELLIDGKQVSCGPDHSDACHVNAYVQHTEHQLPWQCVATACKQATPNAPCVLLTIALHDVPAAKRHGSEVDAPACSTWMPCSAHRQLHLPIVKVALRWEASLVLHHLHKQ